MSDRIWNLFALLGLLSFCLSLIVVGAGAVNWLFERARSVILSRIRRIGP